MKRTLLLSMTMTALLFVAVSPPVLSLSGCATSARTVAYNTLDAVAHTVDSALMAFNDARVAGKVDDATYAKATQIKAQYEAAFVVAFTAAHANLQAPVPPNLTTNVTALLTVLKARTSK